MQVASIAEERRVFWPAFVDWHACASDEEIEQLEHSLTAIQSSPHQPIVLVLKHAIENDLLKQQLPTSLIDRLAAAKWPTSAVVN